jgi:hypothetical protein
MWCCSCGRGGEQLCPVPVMPRMQPRDAPTHPSPVSQAHQPKASSSAIDKLTVDKTLLFALFHCQSRSSQSTTGKRQITDLIKLELTRFVGKSTAS